ncbi:MULTISPECIES: hypothetical protein [unclassified Mycobacterium]|uniref:hypothetical protein n=1 Tax=unclassified Mycobacterium TaxID=2642494 RepID=UPI000FA0B394|nr:MULTISPECIES: hypothetical protein [unclassified Mycobacterium]MDP7702071.1 hypothetical protein [Mycobacterium sp. TY815]MDP7726242.1 hypothetical protein [Mycobacterium sp. TY814]RUP05652.1 MAG: hypothetical protein EKK34_07860 [Mycobacterium sp.]
MKTKVVVLLTGCAVAVVLLLHYVSLSRAGLPVGWMLYLGLPVTAAGVMFALLLANVGAEWETKTVSAGQPLLRRIFHRTKPR